MVTSACDGRYCPDRRHDVADRWLRAPEARASLRADVFPRDTEGHEQTVRGPSARTVCIGLLHVDAP